MSTMVCEYCGKVIINTDAGYIKSCEHYPVSITVEKGRSEILIGDINKGNGFGVNVPNNLDFAFNRILELINNKNL